MSDLEVKVTDREKKNILKLLVSFTEAKYDSNELRCLAKALTIFFTFELWV